MAYAPDCKHPAKITPGLAAIMERGAAKHAADNAKAEAAQDDRYRRHMGTGWHLVKMADRSVAAARIPRNDAPWPSKDWAAGRMIRLTKRGELTECDAVVPVCALCRDFDLHSPPPRRCCSSLDTDGHQGGRQDAQGRRTGRKLPKGSVRAAIEAGEVTLDEIVETFRKHLCNTEEEDE